MFHRFHHPQVRDLAWIALAPPLLGPGRLPVRDPLDGSIWRREPDRLLATLQHLEAQPSSLARLIPTGKDRRLGNYYERLWHALLSLAPDIRVLAHNVTLWQANQTLGELDLLLETPQGAVLHLELAIKFYLGRPEHAVPEDDYSPQSAWWGPDPRDRLDLKVERLLSHQLPLAHRLQSTPGIFPQVDLSCAWLQGYLFYPLEGEMPPTAGSQPTESRSLWCRRSRIGELLDNDSRWRALPYKEWLMPPELDGAGLLTAEQLAQRLETDALDSRRALMLSRANPEDRQDPIGAPRLICVADGWPDGSLG